MGYFEYMLEFTSLDNIKIIRERITVYIYYVLACVKHHEKYYPIEFSHEYCELNYYYTNFSGEGRKV